MIPLLYKNWYNRLITGGLAGMLTWLLAEVIFNIQYRYFDLFQLPVNYLYGFAFGVLIIESFYRTNQILNKRLTWSMNPGKRFFVQILIGIAIAFFWIIFIKLGFTLIIHPGKLIILADELTIFSIVIILIIIQNFLEFGYFINERYRMSLAEVEKYRKENAEYQFEMLKLQLNPHFLFNSLNTLASLIYENADKASEFTRRLSDVYRYVLDNRNKELVTLKEEMDFIRSFTFLLGLRFQGMINFEWQVSDQSLTRKIAPMTLQLLVENAVKHNIASMGKPLVISITTGDDSLSVVNNLQPKAEQNGTGIGLKNISSRYAFLSDKKVEILAVDGKFTVIIPLI